jgi:hypothetical protein
MMMMMMTGRARFYLWMAELRGSHIPPPYQKKKKGGNNSRIEIDK